MVIYIWKTDDGKNYCGKFIAFLTFQFDEEFNKGFEMEQCFFDILTHKTLHIIDNGSSQ